MSLPALEPGKRHFKTTDGTFVQVTPGQLELIMRNLRDQGLAAPPQVGPDGTPLSAYDGGGMGGMDGGGGSYGGAAAQPPDPAAGAGTGWFTSALNYLTGADLQPGSEERGDPESPVERRAHAGAYAQMGGMGMDDGLSMDDDYGGFSSPAQTFHAAPAAVQQGFSSPGMPGAGHSMSMSAPAPVPAAVPAYAPSAAAPVYAAPAPVKAAPAPAYIAPAPVTAAAVATNPYGGAAAAPPAGSFAASKNPFL